MLPAMGPTSDYGNFSLTKKMQYMTRRFIFVKVNDIIKLRFPNITK